MILKPQPSSVGRNIALIKQKGKKEKGREKKTATRYEISVEVSLALLGELAFVAESQNLLCGDATCSQESKMDKMCHRP